MNPVSPSDPSEVVSLGGHVVTLRAIAARAYQYDRTGFLLKDSQGEIIDVWLPRSSSKYQWKDRQEMVVFVAQAPAMNSMLVAVKSPHDVNPAVFRDGIVYCVPPLDMWTRVVPIVVFGLAAGPVVHTYPVLGTTGYVLGFAALMRLLKQEFMFINALNQAVRELALRAGYLRRRDQALDTFAQSRAHLGSDTTFVSNKSSSANNCRLRLMESDRPALPRSL